MQNTCDMSLSLSFVYDKKSESYFDSYNTEADFEFCVTNKENSCALILSLYISSFYFKCVCVSSQYEIGICVSIKMCCTIAFVY